MRSLTWVAVAYLGGAENICCSVAGSWLNDVGPCGLVEEHLVLIWWPAMNCTVACDQTSCRQRIFEKAGRQLRKGSGGLLLLTFEKAITSVCCGLVHARFLTTVPLFLFHRKPLSCPIWQVLAGHG